MVNGRNAHIESFIYVKRSFLGVVAGQGAEEYQDMGDMGISRTGRGGGGVAMGAVGELEDA